MHEMTLLAKSGLGQKQVVSLLEEQPEGSQVLRQRGRRSGHGASGELLVGGTAGPVDAGGGGGGGG
jgi:hypothetical protein